MIKDEIALITFVDNLFIANLKFRHLSGDWVTTELASLHEAVRLDTFCIQSLFTPSNPSSSQHYLICIQINYQMKVLDIRIMCILFRYRNGKV